MVALALTESAVTAAHSPTPAGQPWTSAEIAAGSEFKWDTTVPTWLKPVMQDLLENKWDDSSTNNSVHISFAYNAAGAAKVMYVPTSGCDSDPNWIGCSSNGGSITWIIRMRSNHPSYPWCQINGANGCWDARAIGIHETGHVGGLGHLNAAPSDTVMMPSPPRKPTFGWDHDKIQRCDEARMQLDYGLASLGGPYAGCFDHITNHGATGLKTTVTMQASDTFLCIGQATTITGLLKVLVDLTNYKKLSGNAIANRLVSIQRAAVGSGTWTIYVSTSTSGSGTYSRSIGFTSPQTWQFRVSFAGESGLDAVNSSPVTVQWDTHC